MKARVARALWRRACVGSRTLCVLLPLLVTVLFPQAASAAKLPLSPSMVVNESAGDAALLVDEQALAGDPKTNPASAPTTVWFPGFASGAHPASAYIDLGAVVDLTDVYLRDVNNLGTVTISAGSPGNWTPIVSDGLTRYNVWSAHAVSVRTRYVRVTRGTAGANLSEIVLYGEPIGAPPAPVTDLARGYVSPDSVLLTWTTTGASDTSGQAASYDLRFSTRPITEETFSSAAPVLGLPAPFPAGYKQGFNVTGLSAETAYYFAMKVRNSGAAVSPLSNVVAVTTMSDRPAAKIGLDPSMVTNEGVAGDAGLLVDEQEGRDPKAATPTRPTTLWFPTWDKKYYPISAVIDLGADYLLSDIYFFDHKGGGNITVSTGSPRGWTPQFSDALSSFDVWTRRTTNVTTRYVRVTVSLLPNDSVGQNALEFVLYGTRLTPTQPPLPPPPQPTRPETTMDEFIGTNAFIDDPLVNHLAVGTVREYHNWRWDLAQDGLRTFEPSRAAGGNSWFFDTYYRQLVDLGVFVFPCIKESVPWLPAGKPVPAGADPELPASYAQHAEHMFQFVARYGSGRVEDTDLKLALNQPRVSALGLITHYENWNEPDLPGGASYFTPRQFAAMCSADYDGHLGNMSPKVGLKNADRSAALVMGGTAGVDIPYISKMKYWADWNRNGSFPADVINVHMYSRHPSINRGASPEEDDVVGRLTALVRYRDQYLPGKEIWVTEFGYDTHEGSRQNAPVVGSFSTEEVQGQWLLRSYLALAAAGVDRACQYMLRDTEADNPGTYATSGLTSSLATNSVRKPSWYYVSTLRTQLAGLRFSGSTDSGRPDVLVYRFERAAAQEGAYVVWCPTVEQKVVEQFRLKVGGATRATLVEFVPGDPDGVESSLTLSAGAVTIRVGERPVIVRVDRM